LPPAIAENDPTSTPRAPTHTALPSSPTADDQPAAIIASPTVALYPTPTREVLACGDLDSRMHTNQAGRTTLVPALNTAVRAAPGVSSAEVRRIPPGQTFQVVDGPACADAIAWWRIEGVDRNGSWNGWIGEGRDGTYWIEPLDTGSGLCPGAPSPRLAPGEQARVTLDPPLPSRVRAGPSTGSAYLTSIQPGRIFSVLSGPLCDFEGRWWWQIRFGDVEGWMAEGAGEEYYLEPVQE